jgi:hypothetical protein
MVAAIQDKIALQVSCGYWHSLALLREPNDNDATTVQTDSVASRLTEFTAESAHVELHLPPWKKHVLYFPPMRSGRVYAWGSGTDGQLGMGAVSESLLPSRVACLPKQSVLFRFSCCVGENPPSLLAVVPVVWNILRRVSFVTCSQFHCLVITLRGHVYTWGRGVSGSLGRPLPNVRLVI